MNPDKESHLSQQQTTIWDEQTFEKEFDSFNNQQGTNEKIKIQIEFTSDQKIIYSQNGAVLRIVKDLDVLEKPEIFNNMDQIHNLSWQGQYDQKKKKDGKWNAYWDKEILENVGGQSYIIIEFYTIKKGRSKDYGKIYSKTIRSKILKQDSQSQIFEIGEYYNSLKIGGWKYIYENQMIDFGSFNKDGQKQGKWIDLDEGFKDNKKVQYCGEYDLKGMKVGKWYIMYCKQNENENKQITFKYKIYSGGGSYDIEGNQKKIGKWVELFEGFQYYAQVTQNGQYNMNNMKVGRWDIMYCKYDEREYKQIGGGSYDQEGNQKKIGKWIELDEKFNYKKQITYNGQYNMNNMKVGRWDIMFCDEDEKYRQIGGGSYDQEGNQKKIGKWVELFEGFYRYAQVTQNGLYNMNNMKVGRWDVMYFDRYDQAYKQIGGGSYDQEGNQKKIGKWVELDEKFDEERQVTYNGEYNMNNMKVGRWDINFCDEYEKYRQIIFQIYNYSGGGSYDQEGNQKKIGKWVELHEGFEYYFQITYNGEYNLNGQKVGIWVEINIKRNEKIGQQRYDD